MLTLWRHIFFIKWSMTSKVIRGHIMSSWNFKGDLLLTVPTPLLFFLLLSLSIFSLSCSSLFLFFHPPLPSIPLNQRNNHPTATADKKIWMGNSCSRPSPLLLLLSLYASLSFLSLMFFFSLSLSPPSLLHWLDIHRMPLYLFSLPCSFSLFF